MKIYKVAIIDQTGGKISQAELSKAMLAMQMQVSRDFARVWNVDVSLSIAADSDSMIVGAWPLYIQNNINEPGLAGYHYVDSVGVPYSKVKYSINWTLTASHELLEMLVNPYLDRTVRAVSIDGTGENVEYLVEVADPTEDGIYGYRIDGVLVSNFFYPAFYDLFAQKNVQYDHLGWLTEPRKLLDGGFISWKNARGVWFQGFMAQNRLTVKKLGANSSDLTAAENQTIIYYIIFLAIIGVPLLFWGVVKTLKTIFYGKLRY